MARPRTDIAAGRETLLAACDALIKCNGGAKLTVSAVAAACGMSQSNAYRFFPSKAALLETVATRWFEDVEDALAGVAESRGEPERALRDFVLTLLRLKRDRFDADPALFNAYVELGMRNMHVVERHVRRMHDLFAGIVARYLAAHGLNHLDHAATTALLEDMTVLFRDPRLIASHRHLCTDARANAVLDAALKALQAEN